MKKETLLSLLSNSEYIASYTIDDNAIKNKSGYHEQKLHILINESDILKEETIFLCYINYGEENEQLFFKGRLPTFMEFDLSKKGQVIYFDELLKHSFSTLTSERQKDIEIGNLIRDEVFGGNGHSQIALIRKSLWALNVLRKETSTEEEIAQAEAILQYAESLNAQIQNILDEHYPEE